MKYNQREIDRVTWRAKQTLKILALIQSGDTNSEIARKTSAAHALIIYYRKLITL